MEKNRRFSAENALKWKYSLKTLPAVCLLCFYCFSELLEADLGDFLLNGRCDVMSRDSCVARASEMESFRRRSTKKEK